MRPTALELLRGVRTLLLHDVLPGTATPHLRTQVTLAIGMLDAAAAEFDDAPAAYGEERARMIALAAEALPILRRAGADVALLDEIEALARAPVEPPDRRLTALGEEASRLVGLLDRLAVFCDEHEPNPFAAAEITVLRQRVDAELRSLVSRRTRWLGGLPPAGA